jgi:hypothetical protein
MARRSSESLDGAARIVLISALGLMGALGAHHASQNNRLSPINRYGISQEISIDTESQQSKARRAQALLEMQSFLSWHFDLNEEAREEQKAFQLSDLVENKQIIGNNTERHEEYEYILTHSRRDGSQVVIKYYKGTNQPENRNFEVKLHSSSGFLSDESSLQLNPAALRRLSQEIFPQVQNWVEVQGSGKLAGDYRFGDGLTGFIVISPSGLVDLRTFPDK